MKFGHGDASILFCQIINSRRKCSLAENKPRPGKFVPEQLSCTSAIDSLLAFRIKPAKRLGTILNERQGVANELSGDVKAFNVREFFIC